MSRLVNRNITANSIRTSMRLEQEIWEAARELCRRENISMSDLVARAAQANHVASRTSALRTYVLNYFREAATEDGHREAGHRTCGPHGAWPGPVFVHLAKTQ